MGCYSKASVAISHAVWAATMTVSLENKHMKNRLGSLEVKPEKQTVPASVLGPDAFLDSRHGAEQTNAPVSLDASF